MITADFGVLVGQYAVPRPMPYRRRRADEKLFGDHQSGLTVTTTNKGPCHPDRD
jgi:hypothetical protein